MATRLGGKPPPDSTDLNGWRQAIADGSLSTFRLEALVAAIQDLGPMTDGAVRNALAKHLSDAMIKMLRKTVGFNKPNQGEDIIYRVHFELFEAMLVPHSKDGKGLRTAFWSRVDFRVKDALAVENRHSRIPVEPRVGKADKSKKTDDAKVSEIVSIGESGELPEPANDADSSDDEDVKIDKRSDPENNADAFDGEDAIARNSNRDLSLLHGVRDLDEQIDVDRLMALVTDDRKRLAFYLHMDRVPFGSKRGASIAQAIGKSSKTAEQWVEEVRQTLRSEEEVQELGKIWMGDKT